MKNESQLAVKQTTKRTSQLTLFVIIETILGLLVISGSSIVFLNLARTILAKEVFTFDASILTFFYAMRNPLLTEVMKGISFLGGNIFLVSATIITIFVLWKNNYRKDASLFAFILAFGALLNILLKNIFERERPDLLHLVIEDSFSFPSGHAMGSTVFYLSFTYFLYKYIHKKRIGFLFFFCILLLVLIGISRVYLGVHYPSDVIAGWAAGALWFAFVILFEKTLSFFRIFRGKSKIFNNRFF